MSDFFSFKLASIHGTPDVLGALKGRVILAVNVASECGLTPQYAGLQELQNDLVDERFTVVGFPCNQFGAQEPGTEKEIAAFCTERFGVTFPMSKKIEVNGPSRDALYAWLTDAAQGHAGDIEWNFEKFLISHDGRVLKRYPPTVKPQDYGVLQDIAEALEQAAL